MLPAIQEEEVLLYNAIVKRRLHPFGCAIELLCDYAVNNQALFIIESGHSDSACRVVACVQLVNGYKSETAIVSVSPASDGDDDRAPVNDGDSPEHRDK